MGIYPLPTLQTTDRFVLIGSDVRDRTVQVETADPACVVSTRLVSLSLSPRVHHMQLSRRRRKRDWESGTL